MVPAAEHELAIYISALLTTPIQKEANTLQCVATTAAGKRCNTTTSRLMLFIKAMKMTDKFGVDRFEMKRILDDIAGVLMRIRRTWIRERWHHDAEAVGIRIGEGVQRPQVKGLQVMIAKSIEYSICGELSAGRGKHLKKQRERFTDSIALDDGLRLTAWALDRRPLRRPQS